MKRKKTWLHASRFAVIFLSIVAQAGAVWVLFVLLGKKFAFVNAVLSTLGVLLFLYVVNKKQSAVYKLPWVILILLAPLGGLVIYYTFGNARLSKKQMKKFRCIYDEHHDEYYRQAEVLQDLNGNGGKFLSIIKYARATTSLPVYNNSKTEYLKNGVVFFESLKEEIKKAEKYVFLEYFILEEGVMWDGIFDCLKERIKNGVKVYLSYDDVGSITKVPRKFNIELQKEGVDARRFFKFIPVASVIHNNRDHRKIAVIDGKVGFMSGSNIADEYINVKKPFGRWLDNAVKITGQATDNLVRLFIQLFNMTVGENLNEDDFICANHEVFLDGFVMPFGDSPSPIDDDHINESVYLDIIARADEYLYITTPYLIVDTNIVCALINAVKRGVDVRIIIPEIPDKKPVYIMTKATALTLLSAGVKIYSYRGGFMHSKTFLSDGEIAVVGTANLDFRSLVHHFECSTVMLKTSSIIDIYEDFLQLFDYECNKMSEKDLKLNGFEKLLKSAMGLFAPLM